MGGHATIHGASSNETRTGGGKKWVPVEVKDGALHQFASATSGGAVTPSDATVLDFNALFVGGAGNVSVDHTEGGTAVVYTGVLAGTILPVSGVRVNSTGTTATNITWMKW